MNRTLVIGGLVALAILLGLASWLLMGGRKGGDQSTDTTTAAAEGPVTNNPVALITKPGVSETNDGKTLSLLFSDFELKAAGSDVNSAVYSTTWHLKLQPGERVAVVAADLKGFMSSSGARPEPVAPPPAATPAEGATTAPTPGAATTAPQPATPPPPPKPVAGNGVATVTVSVAGHASTIQWRDGTGDGANHSEAIATSFSNAAHELRNGGSIPVTVTVELNSNGSTNSITQIDSLDLRLFVENVPEPAPVVPAEPAPATTTPAEQPAPTNP